MELVENQIIDCKYSLNLGNLKNIPEGITFNNIGYIDLNYLKKLSKNIIFNNQGFVSFWELCEVLEDTKFNNTGDIYLSNINKLPKNLLFNNTGNVILNNNFNYKNCSFEQFLNLYERSRIKDELQPILREFQILDILN